MQSVRDIARQKLAEKQQEEKNPSLALIVNPEMPPIVLSEIDGFMSPCFLLREDKEFLLKLLPKTDRKARKTIAEGYKTEWLAGIASEPIEHKKQNAGRFKANSWLRQIDKTGI